MQNWLILPIYSDKASSPPEKMDLLFWFYRFSLSPKLELQKATAVDTKIEQFYFRTSSKIKGYCYIGMGYLTSDRTFKVEKDHMTSDLKSSKACGHENGLGVKIDPSLK